MIDDGIYVKTELAETRRDEMALQVSLLQPCHLLRAGIREGNVFTYNFRRG